MLSGLPAATLLAAPAAPSQLRGTALSEDRLRLRWQDNACDESAFIIQVQVADEWRNIPFALDADTSSIILSGLTPATEYRLRLVAVNADGSSPPSPPVTVNTFLAGAPCQVSPHKLCLMDGRFEVTATFEAAHFTGARFAAWAVPDGARTGSFWFFDANNLEISVEMTDGGDLNGHLWVTAGGLSNLEYRLQVVDTVTGDVRHYVNPTDSFCGIDDRRAFPGSTVSDIEPAGSEPGKSRPATAGERALRWTPPTVEADRFRPLWQPPKALCGLENRAQLPLISGRFRAELEWRGSDGVIRTATPRFDSENSGFFVVDEPTLADWALKILDGRFFNEHFWLFWTPLSGRESWLRVTDTVTGQQRRYFSARGAGCGFADTSAFRDASN
ncbi:MAG: fibronectin type III domain-containing protein [Acidobacteriota bacterium]